MIDPIHPTYYDIPTWRYYSCTGCVSKVELFSSNLHLPRCGNNWCKHFGLVMQEVPEVYETCSTPVSAVKVL